MNCHRPGAAPHPRRGGLVEHDHQRPVGPAPAPPARAASAGGIAHVGVRLNGSGRGPAGISSIRSSLLRMPEVAGLDARQLAPEEGKQVRDETPGLRRAFAMVGDDVVPPHDRRRPAVGRTRPESAGSSVVLPAPLGPSAGRRTRPGRPRGRPAERLQGCRKCLPTGYEIAGVLVRRAPAAANRRYRRAQPAGQPGGRGCAASARGQPRAAHPVEDQRRRRGVRGGNHAADRPPGRPRARVAAPPRAAPARSAWSKRARGHANSLGFAHAPAPRRRLMPCCSAGARGCAPRAGGSDHRCPARNLPCPKLLR